MRQHNYYVYILTNDKRTVLYCGLTSNLEGRLWEHREGARLNQASFTAKYKCVNLIHLEHFTQAKDAIAREKEIKGWRREKKTLLISAENPNWNFIEI